MSNLPQKYQVVRNLGSRRGGQNKGILIVQHRQTGHRCIKKKLSSTQVRQGRAQKEIEMLERFKQCENIVTILDNFISPLRLGASIFTEYHHLRNSLGHDRETQK
ncbi:hypothetical protein BDV96DRAFT_594501 [Lophiotrema nucula]|uniref:Protein kinase domain-containing protein n=1 Tax=Lophiotrema nucula TaxID=690887 RepID=A0A6A5ZPB1_9PLEO|nr:hypothetical protein BDV96DRAFT_594501 [Lophiotrema nucula]